MLYLLLSFRYLLFFGQGFEMPKIKGFGIYAADFS